MVIRHLTMKQLKTMMSYAEKYQTKGFNLETNLLPSELCRYRYDGKCSVKDIACPILSFGCECLCIKETDK